MPAPRRPLGPHQQALHRPALTFISTGEEDLTTNPLFSLSIDNPVLSPFYENNTAGILTACTITDAGSGWVYVDATITLSSMADLTGTFHMRMAKTRFAGQIDPPSADYAFSMYDVHVTKLP